MKDKNIRDILENEQVPEELEPENIREMLEEKAPAEKRKRISASTKAAAVAAACAVIVGSAVSISEVNRQTGSKNNNGIIDLSTTASEDMAGTSSISPAPAASANYMSGADDYSQIYELFRESSEGYRKSSRNLSGIRYGADFAVEEAAESDEEAGLVTNGEMKGIEQSVPASEADGLGGGEDDHSDTFNQEEGVLEADMVKTDGRYIYTLKQYDYDSSDTGRIRIVPVKDGEFGEVTYIDPNEGIKSLISPGRNNDVHLNEMYLYNDMLIVVGQVNSWGSTDEDQYYEKIYGDFNSHITTFVSVYSTDDSHRLIDTYFQDGWFSDVRISPEGYLYLISDYSSQSFSAVKNEEDIVRFIPTVGMAESADFIAPEDILMPDDGFEDSDTLSYTVISSLDLNVPGSISESDSKALAGYSGQVYCSAENLYTAAYRYDSDLPEDVEYGFTTERTTQTKLTRIAIGGGRIEPAASGNIEGAVNDQFSMSEYDGYFRVAATCNEYTVTYKKGEFYDYSAVYDDDAENLGEPELVESGYYDFDFGKQDNRLYVLDLDMDMVGSIGGFGVDESVKSVNFNGNMAYVVTYEQTDPLFAIDLSDPASPKILDEFKMLGYSSYMQKWDDGLLLGFGPDADENGRENGVKLVMFDNSDPNELKIADKVVLDQTDTQWFWSSAVYDRKALFIAPEKKLAGFPLYIEDWTDMEQKVDYVSCYKFYTFEDGRFAPAGEISCRGEELSRALYIGDYVYAVSDGMIRSADMDTFEVKDTVKL